MLNMFTALVYDWNMGVFVIGVFALVCVILVAILVNFVTNDKKKNEVQDK